VDLQEGCLKGILGQRRIPEITPQEVVQLALVPMDQFGEEPAIARAAIGREKLFVGPVARGHRAVFRSGGRSRGSVHVYYEPS